MAKIFKGKNAVLLEIITMKLLGKHVVYVQGLAIFLSVLATFFFKYKMLYIIVGQKTDLKRRCQCRGKWGCLY